MFWDQNLSVLFQRTGFTAWPLLLCSIIGLTIMIERVYFFLHIRLSYEKFIHKLFQLLREHKIKEALIFCRKHPNPVVRIAFLYLKNLNSVTRDSILSREGSLNMEKVEERLRGLASITHIAPLLGLLGTVTGLVSAFHQIERLGGQVVAQNLASGIWEALLSTVFGLVIAIPCMAAYHGFENQADRIARRMQTVVSELDEFFGKDTSRNLYQKFINVDDDILKGAE